MVRLRDGEQLVGSHGREGRGPAGTELPDSESSALCCTWEWVGSKGEPRGEGGQCPLQVGPPLTSEQPSVPSKALLLPASVVLTVALGARRRPGVTPTLPANLEAQPWGHRSLPVTSRSSFAVGPGQHTGVPGQELAQAQTSREVLDSQLEIQRN